MKEKLGFIGKSVFILAGGALLGTILLTMVFMIPVNSENRQESYDIMEKEGWYPVMPVLSGSLDTYFHSLLPGVLDDSTDLIMLRTALETQNSNPLLSSMDMLGYSYYWHGYVTILRPLLYLFDYGEIRFLNCIFQMLFVFGLMHILWKKKGIQYALILFTTYVFLMPMAMAMSLQFSWVFYITYGAAGMILWKQEWLEKKNRVFLLFIVVGMLTSFLDLLTYPLYTWAIPLIWMLLVSDEEKSAWCHLKKVIYTGISWFVGYAGMWVSKWILGTLILKQNIFERAFEEVLFRSGVEDKVKWGLTERLEAMYINWKHYEYKLYALLLAGRLLWIIYKSIKNGIKSSNKNFSYLLICFSSVVWYFVLSNHTKGHHFFTYRIWGISIAAMLVLLVSGVCQNREKAIRSVKQLILSAGLWSVIGICSFGLSFFAREDIVASNWAEDYDEFVLEEGNTLNVSFSPSVNTVKDFGIGLKSDSAKGQCIVSLFDGEELLYEETILLEELGTKTFVSIPISWKLASGKEYLMQMNVSNTNGQVYALVTKQGNMPLLEYGEAFIDELSTGGQPISNITYSYRPLSKATILFLTVSWMGVLAGVLLEVKQVVIRIFHSSKRHA